jgi:RNA polymerase sigma factor for flagellar operon FliA
MARTPTGAYGRSAYRDETQIDGLSRDEVVHKFTPRIAAMARRLKARIPDDAAVDLDDLINSGALGLLDAMNRYDPNRDVQFSTFADFRIRGAMLDVLRRLDPISRQARATSNQIESAIASLERRFGRPPKPEEVAEDMGVELPAYWKMVDDSRNVLMVSYETKRSDDSRPLADMLARPDVASVEDRVAMKETLSSLREAITEHLTERQRTVLVLYYMRDLTLKEIGEVLGVTESRVSQIHTESCLRLRTCLTGEAPAKGRKKGAGRARPARAGRKRRTA